MSPDIPYGTDYPDPPGWGVDQQQPEAIWPFVDGASFILDIPPVIPALWGDGNDVLWAEGESLMIAGPMGLGKTTLEGLLIRAQLGIGDGIVLGQKVTRQSGKILILAMDRPAQIARAMARQFTEDERDTLCDRLVIWKGPPPVDLAKQPGMLRALAQAADADVVYLDSIKDAAVGISDDEVGSGYNRARQLLLADGRQLAECHHTRKHGANGGPPTGVTDIYGSAWITNGTGSIILLAGEPGDPIVGFRHCRCPANELGPWELLHDADSGEISLYHTTDLVALVKAKGPDGLTARDAAAAITGKSEPTKADMMKARRKLETLTADRVLVRVDGAAGGASGGTPSAWFLAERRYRE